MRRPKRTVNLPLSLYTKEISYQIFQIVKFYFLKLYIELKETKFELDNILSYISLSIFSPPDEINFWTSEEIKFGV